MEYKTNNAVKLFSSKIVDTVYDQSRLDGLTTTYISTEKLVNYNVASEGMTLTEIQVLKNLKSTQSFLILNFNELSINKNAINTIHSVVAHDLMQDSEVGRFRKGNVRMRNLSVEMVISPVSEVMFEDKLDEITNSNLSIEDKCVRYGALIIREHPFADCNKRTAVSFMNLYLLKNNVGYVNLSDKVIQGEFQDALEKMFLDNDTKLFTNIIKSSILETDEYQLSKGVRSTKLEL